MAGSPIQRSVPLFVMVLLLTPGPGSALLLVPDAATPLTPPSDPAPAGGLVPPSLLEATRLARLRPDVRALLEWYADEQGWTVPPPVQRDLVPADLPAALDAFGAAFAGPGRDPAGLLGLRQSAGDLPPEMAVALARLLYALVDAQALQLAALAPLSIAEVLALADPDTPAEVAAVLYAKANAPLTLAAASTVDAAVLASEPVLKKHGALLQLRALAAGAAVAAPGVARSLPDLSASLAAHRDAAPLVLLGWTEALLAHRHQSAVVPSGTLPEVLAGYYRAMAIPLTEDDILTLAALRGAHQATADAVALNLASGAMAWYLLQNKPASSGQGELLTVLPEVSRIASTPGASPSDLATLARAVDLAEANAQPGALEALALLLEASDATRKLQTTGTFPVSADGRGAAVCSTSSAVITCKVGSAEAEWRTHANGTNSATIGVGESKRTFWGRDVKLAWDDDRCSLTVWRDANNDGRMETAPGADERVAGTHAMCDLANDVTLRDPFGYVVVTGEGSSVIDGRYTNVAYTGRTGIQRSAGWDLWNSTFDREKPVVVGTPTSFSCHLGFFFFFCTGGSNSTVWPPAVHDVTILCLIFFGPVTSLGQDPFRCWRMGDHFGPYIFGEYPGENLTINPDGYQILSIDLGGDDTYLSNAGGTLNSSIYETRYVRDPNSQQYVPAFRTRDPREPYAKYRFRAPVAMAIDLGGDDTYTSSRDFSQGGADLGIGFLLDVDGHDRYTARDYALGAANTPGWNWAPREAQTTMPVFARGGALGAAFDLGGDDQYTAGSYSLAFANRSALGVFYDHAGNDRYTSRHQSQAFANGSWVDSRVEGQEFGTIFLTETESVGAFNVPVTWVGAVSPGYGVALFVERTGEDRYAANTVRQGATSDWAQGRAVNGGVAVMLDLAGTDTGLATNGGLAATDLFSLGLSTRAVNDKNADRVTRNENPSKGRAGSRGVGLALDVDTRDPAAYPYAPTGYLFVAPGAQAEMGEDPIFRLNLYVDAPGLLALGTEQATTWTRDFVLAVDLGGDDFYRNRAGSARLDVEAITDRHDNLPLPNAFGLGQSSCGGVGAVSSGTLTSGCPKSRQMGQTNLVGLNLDLDGRDTYELPDKAAGFGFVAVGMLYDRVTRDSQANDVYALGFHTGGAALALGVGILVDEYGDDLYVSPRSDQSRSMGFGERGGLGILLDVAGADHYQGGRWSLGTAHANSTYSGGIFYDGGGADRYEVPVESQGTFRYFAPGAAARAFPIAINATYGGTSESSENVAVRNTGAGNGGAVALFLDDGMETDVYAVVNASLGGKPCMSFTRNPSDLRCRGNNAVWDQDAADARAPPTQTAATETSRGRGLDNLDWLLNAEFRRSLDVQAGGESILLTPTVLSARGLLLSPSVEFTLPNTTGNATPAGPSGRRAASLDTAPLPGARELVKFEVVAKAVDPTAVGKNALRLADFLLYEEAQRYTCDRSDPYRDAARAGEAPGAEQNNPSGGPHSRTPSYCARLPASVSTRSTSDAAPPTESALPLLAPVLGAAFDLAYAAIPDDLKDPAWTSENLDRALAEAASLAARGNLREAEALLAAVLAGESPGLPQRTEHRQTSAGPASVGGQPNRVQGTEDIRRVEFILQNREPTPSGVRYTNTTLASCDVTGRDNNVSSCTHHVPGVTAWFADNADVNRRCREHALRNLWGCFEMDWNTTARRADGTLIYPDGNYEMLVQAYYREHGVLQSTAVASTEARANERMTDNYGYYPGWARRLIYLDNRPEVYRPTAFVSDFVPDDLQHGLLVFQGFVSEPVRYQVWVRAPGEADFLPIFGTGFNQTALSCLGVQPAPAGCFSRLDFYHRTVDENSGARRWCKDGAGKNVECRLVDSKGAHASLTTLPKTTGRGIPLQFAWRPLAPVEGLYEMRIELWDQTHLPSATTDRGVQATASFSFWGDSTLPEARVAELPAKVGVARVEAASVADGSPRTAELNVTFLEDASAEAGTGSLLQEVRVGGKVRPVRAAADGSRPISKLPVLSFTREAGKVVATIPVDHGREYNFTFTAVDRAGNVQDLATRVDVAVDLMAPVTAPIPFPVDLRPTRWQPDRALNLRWEAPSDDPDFGRDLDRVEIWWAITANGAAAGSWQRLTGGIDPATRTFTFDAAASGVPPEQRVEPYGVFFRAIAVDAFENREQWSPILRSDAKQVDGPVLWDTQGPALVAPVSRAPVHDRAELRWTFDEPAAGAWLNFTRVGPRQGTSGECSGYNVEAVPNTSATVTSPDGRTFLAALGSLGTHSIYQFTIQARDLVGNPMASPIALRFCTDPVANVTIEAPFPNSVLTGLSAVSWTVRDVRLPSGSTASGVPVTYRILVEAGATTVDFGEARCQGAPCFETPEGARRSFTLDSRRVGDVREARLVLLVNTSLNAAVPLRFTSAPFSVDNGAPTTAFAVQGRPGVVSGEWLREPATLIFTPTDTVSGIRGTWVSEDNKTFRPASSLRLSLDGMHTIWFNSTDTAGNAEKPQKIRIGVDTAPPLASLILADGKPSVRHGQVVAELIVEDAPSGVHSATLLVDPAVGAETLEGDRFAFGALQLPLRLPAGDGDRDVVFTVRDRAGNMASVTERIVVDGSPPTLVDSAAQEVGFSGAVVQVATDEDATVTVFVKRATDRAYQARLEGGVAASLHRLTVSNLFPGTAYEVRILAEDALGNRAEGVVRFTTLVDETPPGPASGLNTLDRAEGFLILEWRPADDDVQVSRYAVLRSQGAGAETVVGYATAARYIDANLTPGLTYTYRVRAEDSAGNLGPVSDPAKGRATTRPTLQGGAVTPETGGDTTVFRWTVTYRDLDGDRAAYVRVLVNGKAYEMRPLPGQPDDPRQGVVYFHEMTFPATRLSAGVPVFRFEASDGKHTFRSAVDEVGPMVVGAGHGAADAAGGFSSLFATVRGAPGVAAGLVLLAVAGAAVLVLRRRWS